MFVTFRAVTEATAVAYLCAQLVGKLYGSLPSVFSWVDFVYKLFLYGGMNMIVTCSQIELCNYKMLVITLCKIIYFLKLLYLTTLCVTLYNVLAVCIIL